MSDSDKPVPVFECTHTFTTTIEEFMGEHVYFNGPPGRYVPEADFLRVVKMVKEAWKEGHFFLEKDGCGDNAHHNWKRSQTAAQLRAMIGE